ncbi:hypothetical protein DAPPUDRAFT_242682 [Daphnia pulex]|uniref:Caspase family p20 domain-containing protein n=1 Tax=Daphnia pulex TaxID=6669 RepID=E9GH86_DAPPU|nr:hypothetical protein DAPPUDRAFT_242682 [Daphnia pulex]|eukprot:EFX81154.1 hypothetical protein DAPPUDRAFT_242682 [Daphnia pulex]
MAEKDATKLQNTFNRLSSLVRTIEDLKFDQVIAKIEYLQHRINWDLYDHLVVAIMSHGVSDQFTTSDCREYNIEEFAEAFSGKTFPGLLRKPKMVFLNVCRGDKPNEIMMIPVCSSVASPRKSNGVTMSMERMSIEGAALPKAIPVSSDSASNVRRELRQVNEVVKRNPALRIFIKRIGMNVSLEAIKFAVFGKEKFSVFGKVMEVDEKLNAGLSRSVAITFYSRDAVLAALNHPEPIVLNRVSLKITTWRPDEEPDPPGAGSATCRPGSSLQ